MSQRLRQVYVGHKNASPYLRLQLFSCFIACLVNNDKSPSEALSGPPEEPNSPRLSPFVRSLFGELIHHAFVSSWAVYFGNDRHRWQLRIQYRPPSRQHKTAQLRIKLLPIGFTIVAVVLGLFASVPSSSIFVSFSPLMVQLKTANFFHSNGVDIAPLSQRKSLLLMLRAGCSGFLFLGVVIHRQGERKERFNMGGQVQLLQLIKVPITSNKLKIALRCRDGKVFETMLSFL